MSYANNLPWTLHGKLQQTGRQNHTLNDFVASRPATRMLKQVQQDARGYWQQDG
jgi:hypothetical protein